MMRLRDIPLLIALLGFAAPAPAAEPGEVQRLLEEGQYREAYERSVAAEGADQAAALAGTARALLGTSMKSSDSYFRWFALRAAQPLGDREVAASARRLADAGDRYERSLALEILAHADPAGSRAEFLAALDSPFRTVRLRALRGLASINDPGLSEPLAKTLRDDPDPDIRALAARALARTGAKENLIALQEALDDPVAIVQEEAVRAMVALGDGELTARLRRRLAKAPPERRVSVLRLVALVPDRDLIPDVGPLLADGDPEVRAFAAATVLQIMESSAARQP